MTLTATDSLAYKALSSHISLRNDLYIIIIIFLFLFLFSCVIGKSLIKFNVINVHTAMIS